MTVVLIYRHCCQIVKSQRGLIYISMQRHQKTLLALASSSFMSPDQLRRSGHLRSEKASWL